MVELFKWIVNPKRPKEKWFLIWGNNASVGGWLVVESLKTFPEFIKAGADHFKNAVPANPPGSLMMERIFKGLFEGEILWQ